MYYFRLWRIAERCVIRGGGGAFEMSYFTRSESNRTKLRLRTDAKKKHIRREYSPGIQG